MAQTPALAKCRQFFYIAPMDQAKLEQKARAAADAASATREYHAERDAKIARMAKLKAQRLAREAAAPQPAAKKRSRGR